MNIKDKIHQQFGLSALESPIFYSNPGGLRVELSTGGSYLHQFLTAHKKASEICEFLFNDITKILLVIEYFGHESPLHCLGVAKQLKDLELWPKAKKQHWFVREKDSSVSFGQHFIAYEVSTEFIDNILWSNIASDLGVKPRANCRLHIFDFTQGVHVFPYDDRGLDIVGPNSNLLGVIYHKFKNYLLDYDIEIMRETFEKPYNN